MTTGARNSMLEIDNIEKWILLSEWMNLNCVPVDSSSSVAGDRHTAIPGVMEINALAISIQSSALPEKNSSVADV